MALLLVLVVTDETEAGRRTSIIYARWTVLTLASLRRLAASYACEHRAKRERKQASIQAVYLVPSSHFQSSLTNVEFLIHSKS